ncbi:MAG: hypothetical protein R3C14_22335 [Caldilineaceae bacterium]
MRLDHPHPLLHLWRRLFGLAMNIVLLMVVWTLWGSGPTSVYAQAAPTLTVAPTQGIGGAAVQLDGANFAPGGYSGAIFWDGAQVETFSIPAGGKFSQTFVIPIDAAPGDHTMLVCSGSPCFTGAAAQQASAAFRVTATAPYFDLDVAYVYQNDSATAKAFLSLLERYGLRVTLVTLDEILRTDFQRFALTLIADDTGLKDTWGNASGQAAWIAKNSKVLGLGEGGHAFFGQLGLIIGYPNGASASAFAVYPANPALGLYHSAYATGAGVGAPLALYQDNVEMVAIPGGLLGATTLPLGYTDANNTSATLVSQGCSHLWGFRGSPTVMTAKGRNLFLNAVQQALSMPCGVSVQNRCVELISPAEIPAARRLTFDELANGVVVENTYAASDGVRFENSKTTHALSYGNDPAKTASRPNSVINTAVAPATSAGVPMLITFDEPKSHVGFYMGNGGTQRPNGTLVAYDGAGNIICRASNPVPDIHSEFIGLYDVDGLISAVRLDYGSTTLSESIDDLYLAPNRQGWRIQLCTDVADPCIPATGSVYRTNTANSTPFSVDGLGFVQGANAINIGDSLWALTAMTDTADYTVYRTSGDVAQVRAVDFTGTPGTLRLVVTKQKPLRVQNMVVSAEWYIQSDPQRAAWLRESLTKAANYLYSFTDGQFTLGRILVYQSLDGWLEADLRLHLNNTLQPKANIGGIVAADTVDPWPTVGAEYSPGHIFMGSYWNRYGTPPNQPVTVNGTVVPPSTLVDDWSLAMAHELGHYLLYLFDTYTDVDGHASQELAQLCTGSAMGNVYAVGNQNFVYNPVHWKAACGDTEAYHELNARTEWETIQLWYPWIVPPTTAVVGPTAPPINLTTVNFVAPSTTPGTPATSQVFDLIYQGGELTSGEARVFTLRGDQIFEQGKPPKNATQVELIDAQVNDRLCVYDINDHAEGGEIPRHQFGCEIIQPNDAELVMTKNMAWEPQLALTQVSTTSLSLQVTQTLPAGAQVMAKLYPEHGVALPEQILASGDGSYSHIFALGGPVTPVYVQVWVNEAPGGLTTRREVIADRGTGGSGAFGPARLYGGALVVSSDGKASFESDETLDLGPGESIAWQSMPGTPPLPIGNTIMGQSYHLDAFPSSLVASGSVSIEYEEPVVMQSAGQSSVKAAAPAIYFWNGASWQTLPTATTTPINAEDDVKIASAPSQGVGVYAVLLSAGENHLFLPFVQR